MPQDRLALMIDSLAIAVEDGLSYDGIVSMPEVGLEDFGRRRGFLGWYDGFMEFYWNTKAVITRAIRARDRRPPLPDKPHVQDPMTSKDARPVENIIGQTETQTSEAAGNIADSDVSRSILALNDEGVPTNSSNQGLTGQGNQHGAADQGELPKPTVATPPVSEEARDPGKCDEHGTEQSTRSEQDEERGVEKIRSA